MAHLPYSELYPIFFCYRLILILVDTRLAPLSVVMLTSLRLGLNPCSCGLGLVLFLSVVALFTTPQSLFLWM